VSRGLDISRDAREITPAPVTSQRAPVPSRSGARPFALPAGRAREEVQVRGRTYHLRDTESRTLETVGAFRVVFTRDLRVGVYGGNDGRLRRDLSTLEAAHLVERQLWPRNGRGERLTVVTLTPEGRTVLEASRSQTHHELDGGQVVYAGIVRPSELLHDATLYRMYLTEADRLAAEGLRVRRVRLDHELKAALHTTAAVDGRAAEDERRRRLEHAAAVHHLPIIDGHVQIPDLRLEVEDATGARSHVDLELATEAYRSGALRAKAKAGFAIYRAVGTGSGRSALRPSTTTRGHRTFDPDLASSLFSL